MGGAEADLSFFLPPLYHPGNKPPEGVELPSQSSCTSLTQTDTVNHHSGHGTVEVIVVVMVVVIVTNISGRSDCRSGSYDTDSSDYEVDGGHNNGETILVVVV